MLSSRHLTALQAKGGKHLVCTPMVYVPSGQRLCGKPGRRRLSLCCWVEVVGLEKLAGTRLKKNRGAYGANDYLRTIDIIRHSAASKIKPKTKHPSAKN